MASQITSLTVVYSIVYSGADQRKHQSSASLAFVWGIHRDRWIHTNGQKRGKCFQLMTSSCKETVDVPSSSSSSGSSSNGCSDSSQVVASKVSKGDGYSRLPMSFFRIRKKLHCWEQLNLIWLRSNPNLSILILSNKWGNTVLHSHQCNALSLFWGVILMRIRCYLEYIKYEPFYILRNHGQSYGIIRMSL